MPRWIRVYAGHPVSTDDEGFLTDPSEWLPEMAGDIAREAGIDRLTPAHWRVIALCREEAARSGVELAARIAGLRRPSDSRGGSP